MEFSVESLETPALTKAQLADLLFEQIGLNKRESKDMIDAFFDLIAEQPGRWHGREDFRFRQLSDPHQSPRVPGAIRARARPFPSRRARVVTFHASHKLKEQIQDEARPSVN